MRFRRHLISLALLAAVLCLAWFMGCSTGQADASPRRHHQMTFQFAATIAVDYWNQRSVRVPCHPTYRVMSEAESAAKDLEYGRPILALGEATTCLVTLSWRLEQYRANRDMYYTSYEAIYCEAVIHEFGHLAGLSHAYGGVMSEDRLVQPWGCKHPRRFLRYWHNRHILTPLQP